MIYDINKYSVFSLFTFFLKINYDSDVYLLFRNYVIEKLGGVKTHKRYIEDFKLPYFAHSFGFEKYCYAKTKRQYAIKTKWYEFLYKNTNLPDDMKSNIRNRYLIFYDEC